MIPLLSRYYDKKLGAYVINGSHIIDDMQYDENGKIVVRITDITDYEKVEYIPRHTFVKIVAQSIVNNIKTNIKMVKAYTKERKRFQKEWKRKKQ